MYLLFPVPRRLRPAAIACALCLAAALSLSTAADEPAPRSRIAATETEQQVNTYTTGSQEQPRLLRHDHGFVVVWSSAGSPEDDSSLFSIQGRRFDTGGAPIGGQFQVNTFTTGFQNQPAVAGWPDGRFVVAWYNAETQDVQGRLFHSDGTANGDEFALASGGTGRQIHPALEVTGSGELLAVWQSETSPGPDADGAVIGRRYDSSGSPIGNDFQINSHTPYGANRPDIAESPDGGFVVVWESYDSPGSDPAYSIQMRRLGSDGTPLATDLQVNSYTSGYSYEPAIATRGDGSFVVIWSSYEASPGGDDAYGGVVARRFDSGGSPAGADFQVNTVTTGYQYSSAVAFTLDGFVLAWSGDAPLSADGDGSAALISPYDFSGTPLGGELLIHALHTGDQQSPDLVTDDAGNVVAVWQSPSSAGNDGDSNSIQMRVLRAEADLGVTVSDGLESAVPGVTQSVYVLTLTNHGPQSATNAGLIQTVIGNLDCLPSGPSDPRQGSQTGLTLRPGESVVYGLTCDVDASAVGNAVVTAEVVADQLDPEPADDSASDTNLLTPSTDLEAELSAAGPFVPAGDRTILRARVTNNGPSSSGAGTTTVQLPQGLAFLPSADCTETSSTRSSNTRSSNTRKSGTVTCTFPTLPPEGRVFGISVAAGSDLAEGTELLVTQAVAVDPLDPNVSDPDDANNQDTFLLTVSAPLFADGFETGDLSAWSSALP